MNATPKTGAAAKSATVSATLTLTRDGIPPWLKPAVRVDPARDLRRGPFEIQLDGTSVGSIERDETVDKPLEPGHHTLQMQQGRYSSQAESFEVKDGDVINFHTRGAMAFPRYVASLVKPELAITLKPE